MKSKNILIADDDSGIRQALCCRCESLGLTVKCVSDGLDAIASICNDRPDLAILDINMPAADGLAVCEKLTTDQSLPPLPVVFLTGASDPATLARCESLGAHYVQKGADAWGHLEPILRELLSLETDRPTSPFSCISKRSTVDSDTEESSSPTVLVVDDDPAISKAIKIRLQTYGVETLRAFNGMQGYWTAMKEKPQVVISDFLMPEGHGNYLLGRLKGHELTKHIPVIILTGRSVRGTRDYALERELLSLGAEKFLTKPLDFDALLAALRVHIDFSEKPINTTTAMSR